MAKRDNTPRTTNTPASAKRQSEWHIARCEDCNDEIKVNCYGLRTLCSCDAAE